MKILERELEDFIFDNLNKGKFDYLSNIGLHINSVKKYNFYRQLSLGDYGIADIVGLNVYAEKDSLGMNYAEALIIELKQGPITEKSVIQLLRYKGAIDSALSRYCNIGSELILIGSSVDKELEQSLWLTNPDIYCFTYKLSIGGVNFNCNGHSYNQEHVEGELYIPNSGGKLNKIINDIKLIAEHERDMLNT